MRLRLCLVASLFTLYAGPLVFGTGTCGGEEVLTVSRLSIPHQPEWKPYCVSLTEDGRLAAFQMGREEGYGGLDIWLSRFENGRWSEPYNPGPGVNTSSHEADAKLSADGTAMVFVRSDDFSKSSQVYVSFFRNGSWSEAETIGPPVSLPDTVEFGAVLSKDGRQLYFASNRPGGYGGFDLYYSERIGEAWHQWGEAVNLGPVVNTAEDEVDVAVSPDGRTLIFPARRPDSVAGSVDLYVTRKRDGEWTTPENLGPRINTPGRDSCPWLGYDGTTLYLNSTWDGLLGGQESESSFWLIRYSRGF